MATEILRCTECNAPLRSVPVWLTTAKVKFSCNSCPKKTARPAVPRFDTPIETRSVSVADDPDVDMADASDMDDDLDADVSLDDLDDDKDVE